MAGFAVSQVKNGNLFQGTRDTKRVLKDEYDLLLKCLKFPDGLGRRGGGSLQGF
jgi:hypothetical protein